MAIVFLLLMTRLTVCRWLKICVLDTIKFIVLYFKDLYFTLGFDSANRQSAQIYKNCFGATVKVRFYFLTMSVGAIAVTIQKTCRFFV